MKEPLVKSVYKQGNFNLFLGNLDFAKDIRKIKSYNIKAVISILTENNIQSNILQYKSHNIQHLLLLVPDKVDAKIELHFQSSTDFIDKYENIYRHLKKGNVLVHCLMGRSRSVTIIMAFMIQNLNYSYQKAFQYLLKKQPAIIPNAGFIQKLQNLSQNLQRNNINIKKRKKKPK